MTRSFPLITGVLTLCALSVAALTPSASSAAELTLYRCGEVAPNTGNLTDAHCTTKGEGNYATIPISSPTSLTATSTEPTTLTATLALTKFEISCNSMMSTSASASNVAGPPMAVTGSKVVLAYEECEVLRPEPTKCKVAGGTITTKSLKSTASMEGSVTKTVFVPESGETFTNLVLEGCGQAGLNGSKPITGSVTAETSEEAPTILTTTGTAGGKLQLGGQTAQLSSKSHSVVSGTEETIAYVTN